MADRVVPTPLSDDALKQRNRVTFRATRQILKLVRKARRKAQRAPERPTGDAATFNLMLDKSEKTAHSAHCSPTGALSKTPSSWRVVW